MKVRSIRLDDQLEKDIKEEAEKLKIGYTTLIKQIVREYLDKKKDICE